MTYNPTAPRTLGLEWPVRAVNPFPINAQSALIGQMIPSTVAESIDSVTMYGTVSGSGIWECSVYRDYGAAPTLGLPEFTYARPSADVADGSWLNQANSAVNQFNSIDDPASVTYDASDYIYVSSVFPASPYTGRLAGTTFADGTSKFSGKRILRVRLLCYWQALGNYVYLIPSLNIQGNNYQAGPDLSSPGDVRVATGSWLTNPATGKPWTNADIERFTTTDSFQLDAYALGEGRVYNVVLEVEWVPETRLAFGYTSVPAQGMSGVSFDLSSDEYHNRGTVNQASVETNTTGFTNVTNVTVSRSTAQFFTGAASLLMTATAGADMTAAWGPVPALAGVDGNTGMVVLPNTDYGVSARFRANTTGRTVKVQVQWYDANTVLISTNTSTGQADNNAGWVEERATFTSPVGARYARLMFLVVAAGAAEAHYVDAMMFSPEIAPVSFVAGGSTQRTFFEKENNTKNYLYVFRRVTGTGTFTVNRLDAGQNLSCPTGARSRLPIGGTGDQSAVGALSSYGTNLTTAIPLVQVVVGPSNSVDSQPYQDGKISQVYTGKTVIQEFTPTTTANYAALRALTGIQLDDDDHQPALIVKIKRRSDDVQFGSTITINRSDLLALPYGSGTDRRWPQVVRRSLTVLAALVGGTQYYFELTSTASSTHSWTIVELSTGGTGNDVSFGGNTDKLTDSLVVPSGEIDYRDLASFLLTQAPPKPTNLVATAV